MALTAEHFCPACGGDTTHRLVARTRLHLGVKRKWRCEACEHHLVTVDDTTLAAPG